MYLEQQSERYQSIRTPVSVRRHYVTGAAEAADASFLGRRCRRCIHNASATSERRMAMRPAADV